MLTQDFLNQVKIIFWIAKVHKGQHF